MSPPVASSAFKPSAGATPLLQCDAVLSGPPFSNAKTCPRLRYARSINHASARSGARAGATGSRARPGPIATAPALRGGLRGAACSAQVEHVLILCMDYGLVLFTSDRGISPAAAAKLADD